MNSAGGYSCPCNGGYQDGGGGTCVGEFDIIPCNQILGRVSFNIILTQVQTNRCQMSHYAAAFDLALKLK